MCHLPSSRHHSALALPRRSVEALPSSLASNGRWESGLGQGGEYPTQPLPLPFCSQTQLDPRRCLVLGPGGEGGYQRTPGAPPATLQTSIFLRLCSAQGTPPCEVPEPALHTDASSSIPWPAQGLWPGPPLGEGDILILATLCRPVLSSPSAHPGEQGGWERRGRSLKDWKDPA